MGTDPNPPSANPRWGHGRFAGYFCLNCSRHHLHPPLGPSGAEFVVDYPAGILSPDSYSWRILASVSASALPLARFSPWVSVE